MSFLGRNRRRVDDHVSDDSLAAVHAFQQTVAEARFGDDRHPPTVGDVLGLVLTYCDVLTLPESPYSPGCER